jgi:hypothetical protein
MSLIKNLGSTFIYLIVYLMGYLVLIILQVFARFTKRFTWLEGKLRDSLMWNSTLRFIMQQFPPLLISGILNMYYLRWDSYPNTICSFLSFVIVSSLMISLIGIWWVTKKHEDKLTDAVAVKKFDTLFQGLNLRTRIGRYWNTLVLARWGITIYILIVLREASEVQIGLLLIISVLFQTLLLFGHPWEDEVEHRLSLFNEVMVSLYLYLLLTLTDYN